jgi:hypothetical protein
MAQAALQEELIPSGGIADFVMSDAEIAALESEESEQQFGTAGIARFEPIAKRMASYGRYGDDQVVHAETGELLVPRALIEGNPELKESIFSHLRDMGIEDPDRYVVGSSANSINPDTGLPEFFFKSIRRAVSKVAKGVSKAVSKVGKVLKKVAPVVLPVVLTPFLGPVYAGAVGSGIGSLLNGGSLKDALKASLVGAGTGALFAGATGKGSFFDNIKAATADAGGRFSQLGSAIGESASTGSFKPLMKGYVSPEARLDAIGKTEVGMPKGEPNVTATGEANVTAADVQAADVSLDLDAANVQQNSIPTTSPGVTPEIPATTETSFFDDVKGLYNEYLSPSRGMPSKEVLESTMNEIAGRVPNLTGEALRTAALEQLGAPNIISRYAPLAAVGTGAAALGGVFDAAPKDDPNLVDRRTGMDLIAQNPSAYMVGGRTPEYSRGETRVGTNYGYVPPRLPDLFTNPFRRPEMYAAAGGEVYPRRNGGIMPNEGVADQDSVRALLMPGEFVMTKDAVRGLGGGNLNQGINNMYSMMRNLETRGQVA